MGKSLLDLCGSCFYRDYLPDYEPCSKCLKDRVETGEFTQYINAIWEKNAICEQEECE